MSAFRAEAAGLLSLLQYIDVWIPRNIIAIHIDCISVITNIYRFSKPLPTVKRYTAPHADLMIPASKLYVKHQSHLSLHHVKAHTADSRTTALSLPVAANRWCDTAAKEAHDRPSLQFRPNQSIQAYIIRDQSPLYANEAVLLRAYRQRVQWERYMVHKYHMSEAALSSIAWHTVHQAMRKCSPSMRKFVT